MKARELFKEFPKQIAALAICFLLLIGFGYAGWKLQGPSNCAIKAWEGLQRRTYTCVYLERATTASARERGLSGRESLDRDRGLLFVFPASQQACIWMKDMKFPIDVIWLNKDKKIMRTEERVLPETYPATYCQEDTAYVIEVKSGIIDAAQLEIGQQLKI